MSKVVCLSQHKLTPRLVYPFAKETPDGFVALLEFFVYICRRIQKVIFWFTNNLIRVTMFFGIKLNLFKRGKITYETSKTGT